MLHARTSVGVLPDWRAAIGAGIAAAIVFLILEMVMVPVFLGGNAWDPPRMMAAILLGERVLPMPGQTPVPIDAAIVTAALTVHTTLSIIYAVILAVLVMRVPPAAGLAVGAAFGVTLYIVNFYGFTAVFPWFAMARNWVSIVAHAVFGIVAAWTYQLLSRHPADSDVRTSV